MKHVGLADGVSATGPRAGGAPSLVDTTQLVDPEEGRWVLNVWPDALEASGSFQAAGRRGRRAGYTPKGEGVDPERSRLEAGRRAAGRLRRYAVANRTNRFGTLTYAEAEEDVDEAHEDIADFFRRLRAGVGKVFPYCWVTEWHPGGHGLHVHFAVGRYVHWSVIKAAWGRGRIDIRRRQNLRMGAGVVDEARQAARYLAKYVRKSFGDDRPSNLHRYDVAQGFQPKEVRLVGRSPMEVIEAAARLVGRQPDYRWRSRDEEEWFGPPAIFVSWAG